MQTFSVTGTVSGNYFFFNLMLVLIIVSAGKTKGLGKERKMSPLTQGNETTTTYIFKYVYICTNRFQNPCTELFKNKVA